MLSTAWQRRKLERARKATPTLRHGAWRAAALAGRLLNGSCACPQRGAIACGLIRAGLCARRHSGTHAGKSSRLQRVSPLPSVQNLLQGHWGAMELSIVCESLGHVPLPLPGAGRTAAFS